MDGARIDTRRVPHRRLVQLQNVQDLAVEIDTIVEAAEAGKLQPLGNWSAAQIIWHIARLIELSYDGFPFRYRRGPVWAMRLLRRISLRWLIALAFRPGFVNPDYAASLEPDPSLSLDDAALYFRRQLARLQGPERMIQACSVEGAYSHEEWIYIHLRHAELHLSFLCFDK
jgi:Protein of unknown function (DUF1569)